MNFQSVHFLAFFVLTLLVAYLLRQQPRGRNSFLLLASYFFYMSWDWRFAALLGVATLTNFYAGQVICQSSQSRTRKWALFGALTVNLGVLATFKYLNFFIDSAASLLGAVGLEANLPLLQLALPIGISFFTFQSLSYSIDCYRGKIGECRSLADFALFVAFFPTVLSGPITRAGQLLPQIAEPAQQYRYSADSGLALLCRGFIKKIIFADVLATQLVNPAFDNPAAFNSGYLLLAVYAYSLQIYMDLSAYTDIARGMARMLGFHLPENFNQPYKADSVSNFWQRWHMSMSGFFRDYLYFALGGSLKGNVYLNLLITFVAIGLWHGAGWNFILYGFLHGGIVGIERYFRSRRKAAGLAPLPEHGWGWLLRVALVFQFIALSRILFRAEDLTAAQQYATAMLGNFSLSWPALSPWPLLLFGFAIMLHYVPAQRSEQLMQWCCRQPAWLQAGALMTLTLALFTLVNGEAGFVYFQF